MENVTKPGETWLPVGERVRKLREQLGYTQEELAGLLPPDRQGRGRSEKTIGRIERGETPLSGKYAIMLSKALNCRPQYLLGEDNFITEKQKLSYSLDRMEESAKVLHSLIKGIASNYGYEIKWLDENTTVGNTIILESCYAVVDDTTVIACLSLDEYTHLRSEIAHYSAYLFGNLLEKARTRLATPFAYQTEDVKNG